VGTGRLASRKKALRGISKFSSMIAGKMNILAFLGKNGLAILLKDLLVSSEFGQVCLT
jgi:hypothetical protein